MNLEKREQQSIELADKLGVIPWLRGKIAEHPKLSSKAESLMKEFFTAFQDPEAIGFSLIVPYEDGFDKNQTQTKDELPDMMIIIRCGYYDNCEKLNDSKGRPMFKMDVGSISLTDNREMRKDDFYFPEVKKLHRPKKKIYALRDEFSIDVVDTRLLQRDSNDPASFLDHLNDLIKQHISPSAKIILESLLDKQALKLNELSKYLLHRWFYIEAVMDTTDFKTKFKKKSDDPKHKDATTVFGIDLEVSGFFVADFSLLALWMLIFLGSPDNAALLALAGLALVHGLAEFFRWYLKKVGGDLMFFVHPRARKFIFIGLIIVVAISAAIIAPPIWAICTLDLSPHSIAPDS